MYLGCTALSLWLLAHLPPGYSPRVEAASSVGSAHPADDARRAFVGGRAAFSRGEYQKAAEFFGLAQQIFPHPNTLYNLALALEANGQAREAWPHYMSVAHQASNPADREDARIRADHLLDRLAMVRFHATQTQLACIDGKAPTPDPQVGWFSAVVEPGEHSLVTGNLRQNRIFRAGTVYEIQLSEQPEIDQRNDQRAKNVAIVAASVGVAALGLQIGALALHPTAKSPRLALGLSSIGLGAAALGLGISAWKLKIRNAKNQSQRNASSSIALVCAESSNSLP